jgi:SAM-dependent methyltransferase
MPLVRAVRAAIYDAAIVPMTRAWYGAVLDRLPRACRLLDVGIGTGASLLTHAGLLVAKDIRVTGVDIDRAYVERCRAAVARHRLGDRIGVRLESITDHRGGPYDAVYFSASFMLLPDPAAALRHVCSLLAPGGRLYFTQTFEHAPSRATEFVKPLLRRLTTIDFGRVTYEGPFRRVLVDGGVATDTMEVLHRGRRRSAVLVVARPSAAPG